MTTIASEETKYKVGDKVLISEDLVLDKLYGEMYLNRVMKEYSGEVAVITRVYTSIRKEGDSYIISLDNGRFGWTDEMFVGKVVDVDWDNVEKGSLLVLSDNIDVDEEFHNVVVKFISDGVEDTAWVLYNDIVYTTYKKNIEGVVEVTDKTSDDCCENPNICHSCSSGYVEDDDFATSDAFNISLKEEPVKPTQRIIEPNESVFYEVFVEKVIFNNPATILFYRIVTANQGEKEYSELKKVVSTAQYDDEFDEDKGLDICLLKAVNRSTAKTLNKY